MLEITTGVIALVLSFTSFFFDRKKITLVIYGISLVFYASHLWIIGSIASGLFLLIQVGRNLFFAKKMTRGIHTIGLGFFILLLIYVYYTKRIGDPLSWLTLIGSTLGTIACWVNNTKHVRLLFLLSSIPWMYYVLQLDSIFPLLLQIAFTSSLVINIIRFDVIPKFRK